MKYLIVIFFIEPIVKFLIYAAQLKHDKKVDYEKCRKYFLDGLSAMNEANNGNLKFENQQSASKSITKTKKRPAAAEASTIASRPSKAKRSRIDGKRLKKSYAHPFVQFSLASLFT